MTMPIAKELDHYLLNPPAEIHDDPQALLEYARRWMTSRCRGASGHQKRNTPTTGTWLTDLLIEALARELEAKAATHGGGER